MGLKQVYLRVCQREESSIFFFYLDESSKPYIVLSPPAHKLLRVNMLLEYEVYLICLSGVAKLLVILIQSWQEMH